MAPLPELGVGVIYVPGLEPLIQAGRDLIDVIEVEPQTCWVPGPNGYGRLDPAALEWLDDQLQPVIAHGVVNPLGGSQRPDPADVDAFADAVRALGAAWCSEHLSFNRFAAGDSVHDAGFLLPPLQSASHAFNVARNIRAFARRMPVPVAFETGVNYLAPQPGELDDGIFFRTVADVADCGIVLDLHNLWCNERNGRATVDQVIDELPLERVWEIHVAGGQTMDGYTLDSHSDLTPEAVLDLAARVVPRLPNLRALIFEILPDWLATGAVDESDFVEHLARLQGVWATRASATRPTPRRPLPKLPTVTPPTAQAYEETLGRLVTGMPEDAPLLDSLRGDHGVSILRKLVAAVRAGSVVERLRLTYRLVVLACGHDRFQSLLEAFWAEHPPQQFAAAESAAFGAFLQRRACGIPGLRDVLAFELGAQRAQLNGEPVVVRLTYEPNGLLVPLLDGKCPDLSDTGSYEMTLSPAA